MSVETDAGLAAFVAEARRRLGSDCELQAARDPRSYRIEVRRGGQRAGGALKATFFDAFAASGGVDHCHCVEHFFEHLERQLEG